MIKKQHCDRYAVLIKSVNLLPTPALPVSGYRVREAQNILYLSRLAVSTPVLFSQLYISLCNLSRDLSETELHVSLFDDTVFSHQLADKKCNYGRKNYMHKQDFAQSHKGSPSCLGHSGVAHDLTHNA